MFRNLRRYAFMLAAALPMAAMVACFDDDDEGQVQVASQDLEVDIDADVAEAVEGTQFTFADGGAITTQPGSTGSFPDGQFTFTFTGSGDDPPFSISSTGGTATGTTSFGSCTFTVSTSTYASGDGPQSGDVIIINPCGLEAKTDGVQVGNATTVAILLIFGITPSNSAQASVVISADGTVEINDEEVGSVNVVATGGGSSQGLITF